MLLSIIVINYKTFDLTSDCLKSLYALLSKEIGKNAEVIAVDNGSGPPEVKKLQKLRDRMGFKLLTSETNFGFASGCNMGVEISEGELLLFLNSDTKSHDGIIEMAKELKKNPEVGVLGGKILKPDGKKEKSAGKFYNLLNLFLMLFAGERVNLTRFSPKDFVRVDWVSGGFMMVKREVFNKVSGFDEDYFMYLEDMDLCLRAEREGYETYFYPKASMVHTGHGSAGRGFAIASIYKSLIIFYRKNKGELKYKIAVILLRSKAIIAYSFGKIMGKKEIIETYSQVLRANF